MKSDSQEEEKREKIKVKRNVRKLKKDRKGRGSKVGERWKEKKWKERRKGSRRERMEEEISAQEGWGKEKRKGGGRREEGKVKGKMKK